MKLRLIAATMLAAGSTVAMNGQAPAADGERMTVSGCLQRAQRDGSVGGTVVGTSASPNTADDEANSAAMVDAFLLAEATPSPAAPSSPPSTASTTPAPTGTSGSETTMTTFGLQGREAELERHQGARLEVTGTVIPPATSGRGTGGAATKAGAKRLKVESFKVIAEKCQAR